MNKLIQNISNGIAVLGVAMTAGSGLARVLGMYYIVGYQTITVFSGGMGLMLIGIVGILLTIKSTA